MNERGTTEAHKEESIPNNKTPPYKAVVESLPAQSLYQHVQLIETLTIIESYWIMSMYVDTLLMYVNVLARTVPGTIERGTSELSIFGAQREWLYSCQC